MKIISFEDIRLLQITPEMCFDWAESTKIKSKHFYLLKLVLSLRMVCSVM